MNGSRSAELANSDVILDSNPSDPIPDSFPASSMDEHITDGVSTSDHQAIPGSMLEEPQLEHADLQGFSNQARQCSEAVHHRPAASWQQSEASMLEVASTSGSGSAESGIHTLTLCEYLSVQIQRL